MTFLMDYRDSKIEEKLKKRKGLVSTADLIGEAKAFAEDSAKKAITEYEVVFFAGMWSACGNLEKKGAEYLDSLMSDAQSKIERDDDNSDLDEIRLDGMLYCYSIIKGLI